MPVELTPVSAGGGDAPLTVAEARAYVRQFARNAADEDEHTDAEVDRAIYTACTHFLRTTRCAIAAATLTLTAGSAALPALPAGFKPERLKVAYIPGIGPLRTVDAIEVELAIATGGDTAGIPRLLAFDSLTAGRVYPAPDTDRTLTLRWWETSVTWEFGDAGDTALNVPREHLPELLILGATALLQHTDPDEAYASESWQKYLAFAAAVKAGGAGSLAFASG